MIAGFCISDCHPRDDCNRIAKCRTAQSHSRWPPPSGRVRLARNRPRMPPSRQAALQPPLNVTRTNVHCRELGSFARSSPLVQPQRQMKTKAGCGGHDECSPRKHRCPLWMLCRKRYARRCSCKRRRTRCGGPCENGTPRNGKTTASMTFECVMAGFLLNCTDAC